MCSDKLHKPVKSEPSEVKPSLITSTKSEECPRAISPDQKPNIPQLAPIKVEPGPTQTEPSKKRHHDHSKDHHHSHHQKKKRKKEKLPEISEKVDQFMSQPLNIP